MNSQIFLIGTIFLILQIGISFSQKTSQVSIINVDKNSNKLSLITKIDRSGAYPDLTPLDEITEFDMYDQWNTQAYNNFQQFALISIDDLALKVDCERDIVLMEEFQKADDSFLWQISPRGRDSNLKLDLYQISFQNCEIKTKYLCKSILTPDRDVYSTQILSKWNENLCSWNVQDIVQIQ